MQIRNLIQPNPAVQLVQQHSTHLQFIEQQRFVVSKIIRGPPAFNFSYRRVKTTVQFFDESVSSEEMVKMLNDESFRRVPEMIRALVPACVSLQISIKMGLKLFAQTAAFLRSVEHVFCNFEAGINFLFFVI